MAAVPLSPYLLAFPSASDRLLTGWPQVTRAYQSPPGAAIACPQVPGRDSCCRPCLQVLAALPVPVPVGARASLSPSRLLLLCCSPEFPQSPPSLVPPILPSLRTQTFTHPSSLFCPSRLALISSPVLPVYLSLLSPLVPLPDPRRAQTLTNTHPRPPPTGPRFIARVAFDRPSHVAPAVR